MDAIQKYFNPVLIVIGVIGGFLADILGGWDMLSRTIILLIVIDYITGLLKAIYKRNLSSEVGYKGIIKKAMILLVIAMACLIEKLFGNGMPVREMTMALFIGNESISILENATACGLPVPQALKELLIQIKGQ